MEQAVKRATKRSQTNPNQAIARPRFSLENEEMHPNVPAAARAPVTKRTHCARVARVARVAMLVAGVVAAAPAMAQATDKPLFDEVTARVGFPEKPPIYPDGQFLTPEITPGGVALFDYNNDGRLDILVICHPPPMPHAQMIKATAPNRLFRQTSDGQFVVVEGAAGLGGTGFHHGVAVGDANNDGFVDVYVSNYGSPDQLFVNNGNATFTDATSRAG